MPAGQSDFALKKGRGRADYVLSGTDTDASSTDARLTISDADDILAVSAHSKGGALDVVNVGGNSVETDVRPTTTATANSAMMSSMAPRNELKPTKSPLARWQR